MKAAPHGPKLANVSRVVIWVNVLPAKNPNGINQRAIDF
jgi:hypothetical protein